MEYDLEEDSEPIAITSSQLFAKEPNHIDDDVKPAVVVKEPQSGKSVFHGMDRNNLLSVMTFCFANFCTGAFYSLLGPFFPQEAADKGLSSTQTGIVFAGFEFVIIVSTPIYGTFLTNIGAKFTYNAGIFVSGVCAIIFGFMYMVPPGSTFFYTSLAVRSVEALGVSAYFTASFAIIAHTFPDKAAAMIGTLEMFTGLGLMVGPPIGGILYQYGGFGMPFWCVGGVLLLSGVVTIFTLPAQRFEPETSGSLLSLIRIPLVVIVASFVSGAALCIGFLDVALSLHLEQIYDFNAAIIGLIFLVGPGAYSLTAPIYGWVADKVPQYATHIMLAGFSITALGFTFLGPVPFLGIPNDMLWLTLLSLLFFGLGIGTMVMSFSIIYRIALQNGFEESLKTFGIVSAIFNTFFPLGAIIGPIIGGTLVDNVGFEWASFVIGMMAAFLCLVLVVYLIVEKCCCPKENAQNFGTINERTPLLISENKDNR